MTRLLSLALICGLGPGTVRGDVSPDPASLVVSAEDRSRAEDLVRRLASPAYPDRAGAMRELREMGRRALAVIDAAAADPDAEIRYRCELLLPAARADDLAARLASFVADARGEYDHDLPGWDDFRALAGGDGASRRLYARLFESEPNRKILTGFRVSDQAVADRLAARCTNSSNSSTRGSAARVQELHADGRGRGHDPVRRDRSRGRRPTADRGDELDHAGRQHRIPHGVRRRRGPPGPARIVRPWLDSRPGPNGPVLAMSIARNLDLDYPRYIHRVIAADDVRATSRASAMGTLARLGGVGHIDKLTPQFTNEDVVRPMADRPNIELRDTALAMAMVLAGKDPTDLGFVTPNSPRSPNKYSYLTYQFPTDEARTKGFAKWKEIAKTLPAGDEPDPGPGKNE